LTIFGLGNPTERYARTRHNVGFMVLDVLARRLRVRFRHAAERYICRREFAGTGLVLVKPLLYMNDSGVVVRDQLSKEPDDVLVVCDDMALPFGRLRLRPSGSDGGHNGLGSIVYHLGRTDFARLRIGIDSPPVSRSWVDWVLEPFPSEQARQLPELLDRAADACLAVVTSGITTAMNRYNPGPASDTTQSRPLPTVPSPSKGVGVGRQAS
jgi:PTH1 family peptidyl-tRNA hydrolase